MDRWLGVVFGTPNMAHVFLSASRTTPSENSGGLYKDRPSWEWLIIKQLGQPAGFSLSFVAKVPFWAPFSESQPHVARLNPSFCCGETPPTIYIYIYIWSHPWKIIRKHCNLRCFVLFFFMLVTAITDRMIFDASS